MDWFKIYTGWCSAVETLSDEEAGRIFKGIYAYALRGEVPEGTGREQLFMAFVLDAMKNDLEKYEKAVAEENAKKERRRLSAQHAAEARWGRGQAEHADVCGSHDVHTDACDPHKAHTDACDPHKAHTDACQNKNKDKEIYTETEGEIPSSCAELPAAEIPLNDGSLFSLRPADLEELASLYPAVDVAQELRNMRGWCMGNPDRLKTRRGVKRFIHGWLSRAQDRGGKSREPPENPFLSYARGEKEFGDLAL